MTWCSVSRGSCCCPLGMLGWRSLRPSRARAPRSPGSPLPDSSDHEEPPAPGPLDTLTPAMRDVLQRLEHVNDCNNLLARTTLLLQEAYCQRLDDLGHQLRAAERIPTLSWSAFPFLLPGRRGGAKPRPEHLLAQLSSHTHKQLELHRFFDQVREDARTALRACERWVDGARADGKSTHAAATAWLWGWTRRGWGRGGEDVGGRERAQRHAFLDACTVRMQAARQRQQGLVATHYRVLHLLGEGEGSLRARIQGLQEVRARADRPPRRWGWAALLPGGGGGVAGAGWLVGGALVQAALHPVQTMWRGMRELEGLLSR
jgi:hypothetical protein